MTRYGSTLYHMYTAVPIEIRDITVDNSLVAAIERVAARGIRYPALAWAVGLTPDEFGSAASRDYRVGEAYSRGRAQGELQMANVLFEAAESGDSRSALAMLQHRYGWQTKHDEVDTALKERELTKHDLKKLTIEELQTMHMLALKAEGKTVDGVATRVE